MGHESQIELWSPKLTTFCFAGFGTNRFRCQEAMKTAGRENPKRWALVPSNRAHGAVGQNNSRSIKWAAKQEKFQPKEKCFFLTSTFIELIRSYAGDAKSGGRILSFLPALIRRHGLRWNLVDALNDAINLRLGNTGGAATNLLKKHHVYATFVRIQIV